uniref:Vegetative incompatibility protein 2 n=1 Tax=Cryphonectria parasitica TaxID=5116 RepID=G8H3Q2_CRYPA|nr:vegetative incompatibility protein 2 [Cryphonectria parasitica]
MSFFDEKEPINLLACDGGGIRGVSELVILHELMKAIQEKGEFARMPKPCDYFHIIGGTSTGGLVAIMLGRLEMSTEEAIAAYDGFASDIFSKRRPSLVEKYKAKQLEATVQRLVRDQGKGILMRDGRPRNSKGRAFVCTMPEQKHRQTVRLRAYEAAGDKYPNVLIYEAARATTAATTYFRPMSIRDEDGREERFVDAALGMNNPISICLEEAAELFGPQRMLGCIVSLGTGSRQVEMRPYGSGSIRYLWRTIKVVKEIGTDSEKDHEKIRAHFADYDNTYFRFNVDGGAQGIELSDWQKIGELKERTRAYLQTPDVKKSIDDLADVLVHHRTHGLTLNQGRGINKNMTIPAQPRFIRRGRSSNTFTGRDNILRRLDECFEPRAPGNTSRREFQLRGMSRAKLGMCTAALMRGIRFHIIWIDATDKVTIEQSFHHIATSYFGTEGDTQPVEKVLNWLKETAEEWLLVFDNAPDSGLFRYRPDGDIGNFLYTTRHQNLQPRLQPQFIQDVEEMEIQEAAQLLIASAQVPSNIEANRKVVDDIVKELGLLPLAIDQAGAYIHMAPCQLDKYLDVFNKQKQDLLKDPQFTGGDEARHIAVYATFNISFKAIKTSSEKRGDLTKARHAEVALMLLRLLCFYHNEGLLFVVFLYAAKERHKLDRNTYFPVKAGDVDLNELVEITEQDISPEFPDGQAWVNIGWIESVKLLEEFSLIKFNASNGYSSMHVLVHDWARSCMEDEEKREWALAARCLLMDSISLGTDRLSAHWHKLIMPHLQVVMKYANIPHADLGLESEYQIRMARALRQSHKFKHANTALQQALDYRKKYFGIDDLHTFDVMRHLARLYEDQGLFAEAESMLLELIDRRRLQIRDKMWTAALETNSTDATREVEMPAFYSEKLLDNAALNTDTKQLLIVLMKMDSRQAAEKVMVDLLKWTSEKFGEDNSKTRFWQDTLDQFRRGLDVRDTEDSTLRVERAREEVKVKSEQYGPFEPQTLGAERQLAKALELDGAFQEADDRLTYIIEYCELIYGKHSLQHIDAIFAMAKSLNQQMRPYEADEILVTVLDRYGTLLGQQHPKTLEARYEIGFNRFLRSDYTGAIEAMKECYDRRKEVLGSDHWLTKMTGVHLAHFQHMDKMVPPWNRDSLKEIAVENTLKNMGDLAPEWMKQWKPGMCLENAVSISPNSFNFSILCRTRRGDHAGSGCPG